MPFAARLPIAFVGYYRPDPAGWSAHVTIQNKVPPREAKALFQALGNGFAGPANPDLRIRLHRYLAVRGKRSGRFRSAVS